MKKDAFPAVRHKELLSNGGSETLHSSLCLWTCSTFWSSHCHLTSISPHFSGCFFCLPGGDFSADLQRLSGSNCRRSSTSAALLKEANKKIFLTIYIRNLTLYFSKQIHAETSHYPALNANNSHFFIIICIHLYTPVCRWCHHVHAILFPADMSSRNASTCQN